MTDETASPGTGMRIKSRLGRAASFVPLVAIFLAMGVGHDASNRDTWLGLMPSAAKAAAPSLPAPPANGEMGFVSWQFHMAFHNGGDAVDCPDGRGPDVLLRASYMRTLSKADQDRLNLKANENEREAGWKAYGRNAAGGNICSNIYEFMDRPPIPMMKGPVQYGLNLDNDTSGDGKDNYTCKHTNFTSPTGEKGIDNQIWRAEGCTDLNRGVTGDGNGDRRRGQDDFIRTAQYTQVLLLRGVNSLVNDKDVEVIYANTDDRPAADSAGKPVFHGSYTIADGPKLQYRNVLHGHILNGVLTTDTHDIHLSEAGNGNRAQFDLARGRLRLEFQPDGSLKGLVGGYQPLLALFGAARGGGLGTVNTAGLDCAGEYAAVRMMADGDKDPKTGQCRRISYAYELVAIPGFVNDVVPEKKIASK